MNAGPKRQADDASPAAKPWIEPLAFGTFLIVNATALFWLASLDFKPPPEPPKSLEATLEEAAESSRESRELLDLLSERSRVTDAIGRRIKEIEARPVAGDDHAARDDELRRLQKTQLAELEKTSEILNAQQAEREERKRLADAPRRKQVAQAAWEWQRKRRVMLATGFAAAALVGWLLWQAHLRHHEQAIAERAAGVQHGRSARREAGASDPHWNKKLAYYAFMVAIGIAMLMYGLSDRAARAEGKYRGEDVVFFGVYCLATATWWLFFGSIDWSTWNAIKDRVTSRKSSGDDERPPDPSVDG